MGRKSRFKKERRERKATLSTNQHFLKAIYDFFKEHEEIDLDELTQEEMNALFDRYIVHNDKNYTTFSFEKIGEDESE